MFNSRKHGGRIAKRLPKDVKNGKFEPKGLDDKLHTLSGRDPKTAKVFDGESCRFSRTRR